MPLPLEISDWIARSEVDHVGPFVNAWAAFNAWYRYASGSAKDSDGLKYVRTKPNPVRSALLPFLDPLTEDTADASEFKQDVAALHRSLEAFRLESTRNGPPEHISFRSIPLKQGKQLPQQSSYGGRTYKIEKVSKKWVSTVRNRAGVEVARVEQEEFDLSGLEAHSDYGALPAAGKGQLRALYLDCTPRPMANLLHGDEPPIIAGTITFRCTCEDLFGGIIVTIYRMRNLLLHGELKPDASALAAYQPAYHLLRRMLREVR